jgi:hypothetical protein
MPSRVRSSSLGFANFSLSIPVLSNFEIGGTSREMDGVGSLFSGMNVSDMVVRFGSCMDTVELYDRTTFVDCSLVEAIYSRFLHEVVKY